MLAYLLLIGSAYAIDCKDMQTDIKCITNGCTWNPGLRTCLTDICGFQNYAVKVQKVKGGDRGRRYNNVQTVCGCESLCTNDDRTVNWIYDVNRKKCQCKPGKVTKVSRKIGYYSNTVVKDNAQAKNVIVYIVDGMGNSYNSAHRSFMHGQFDFSDAPTLLDQYLVGTIDPTPPNRGASAKGWIPDSAATASAYSSGVFTDNERLAVDQLGNPVGTILEAAKRQGKAVGVVATSRITHATPAAFYSHSISRKYENLVAKQLLMSEVDVAFGGGRRHFMPKADGGKRTDSNIDVPNGVFPTDKTWTYAKNKAEMDELTADDLPAVGLFASSHMAYHIDREYKKQQDPSWDEPSIKEMATKIIELLEEKGGDEGFFLMVESSRVDHCGHDNDIACLLREMEAMDAALKVMIDYTNSRDDTTFVVMPDHECGGLTLSRPVNVDQDDYKLHLLAEHYLHEKEINVANVILADELVKDYPVYWSPDLARDVKVSRNTMAGLVDKENNGTNIVDVVEEMTGWTLTDAEQRILFASIEQSPIFDPALQNGGFFSYWGSEVAYRWAIAEVVNHRIGVSFSTHQHSALDIEISAAGVGSEFFRGHQKNVMVGRKLAALMGVNLDVETQRERDRYVNDELDVCDATYEIPDIFTNEKGIAKLPAGNLRPGLCGEH